MTRGRPPKNISPEINTEIKPEANAEIEKNIESNQYKNQVIDMLNDLGITADKNKSIEELMEEYRSHVSKMRNQIVDKEVSKINANLNYLKGKTNITDESFLVRLLEMHVPVRYLERLNDNTYLFSDADAGLNDDAIWEIIRYSGVNLVEKQDLFTKKIKRPRRYMLNFTKNKR
jgi:hypothetical protein